MPKYTHTHIHTHTHTYIYIYLFIDIYGQSEKFRSCQSESSFVILKSVYARSCRGDVMKENESIVIYEALCFDVAQGRLNGAPNETRNHSCRFASQAC